ncbi:MAG: ribosome biogenesis GTP-binding protein YihA/YsxC [Holosporales bacterium]|jgi:GTP-binding protein|nr:ribosome biogenesis GTP-binding protein YihA/YsxC [Holosporales bacterium]
MDITQAELSGFFSRPCCFIAGAAKLEQMPSLLLPEVAFIGRSNVGKSSLINAMLGRKTLVRTSRHPGRTQQINFFELDARLHLVDLPGYGFATVSKKIHASWNALIVAYLKGRPLLRRVLLLIDSRHGFKENDRDFMKILDAAAVVYQCIFTKIDKATETERMQSQEAFKKEASLHGAIFPTFLETSAEKRDGIQDLQHAVYSCCF